MKLTTNELCEIAGCSRARLESWAEYGVLEGMPDPEDSTRRLYSFSECLAIATALRYSAAGASFERVVGVGQLLRNTPIERVEAEIAAGRMMPVPAAMLGIEWLPGMFAEMPKKIPANVRKLMKEIDLPTILNRVRSAIEELSRKHAKTPRKRRSLVTA